MYLWVLQTGESAFRIGGQLIVWPMVMISCSLARQLSFIFPEGMKELIMNRIIMVIISIIAGFLPFAGSCLAQGSYGQLWDRFNYEFERTEQAINRAQTVLAESQMDRGKGLLKMAIEIQSGAGEAGRNNRFLEGIKLTLSAREKARAAMTISRQADENENLVQRQLEQTDNLITQIQDRITPNSAQMILSLFDSARENQRRAWEFFRNQSLRPALKMSRQAEKVLKKLLEKLRANEDDAGRLQKQISRLEQRLAQAETQSQECSDKEAAGQLLRRADEALRQGQTYADSGEIRKAENALKMVRQLLAEISALCSDHESLGQIIEQLKSEMNRLAEKIESQEHPGAIKMLETARNHIVKAEKFCLNNKTEACAANIKAAQISLQKAKKIAGI